MVSCSILSIGYNYSTKGGGVSSVFVGDFLDFFGELFYYFENGVVTREVGVDGRGGRVGRVGRVGGRAFEEVQGGFPFVHEGVEFFSVCEDAGGDHCAEVFEDGEAGEVGPDSVLNVFVASETIEVYDGTGVG